MEFSISLRYFASSPKWEEEGNAEGSYNYSICQNLESPNGRMTWNHFIERCKKAQVETQAEFSIACHSKLR